MLRDGGALPRQLGNKPEGTIEFAAADCLDGLL
jgi:hypothetical protein